MRKYYLKLSTLIILLVFSGAEIFSQQDAQYTQYMYKGGSIIRDEIGPTEETTLSLDFSYTIPTSEKGRLSFGLKGTGHLLNSNFQELNAFNPTSNDPRFQQNIDNKFSPNVGVGLFYHTKKFYMGLSAPNLLETSHFDSINVNGQRLNTALAEERVNLYLISGYVFKLSDNMLLKPALLFKGVDGAPLQADISANALLYKKFTVGVAYRWDAAISGLVGFNVSDSFMIGFAYDRDTSDLGNVSGNDGSYEILMRFELFEKISNIITPRFF